jgi:hypothetical protein
MPTRRTRPTGAQGSEVDRCTRNLRRSETYPPGHPRSSNSLSESALRLQSLGNSLSFP